ncbi:MAG: hypothetical protein OIN87_10975 [Candidatus Methanoperedens sp.]|nr:hypothetical protein [Candidatus Methanoperedens sp.]
MNSNKVSYEFANNEMRQSGEKIRSWAQQSDNILLKSLALEVIAITEGK